MKITINDFVNAIADKLKLLYPNFDIWCDCIKQFNQTNNVDDTKNIVSSFFIDVIKIRNNQKLWNRNQRNYDFDIYYFIPENKSISFFEWTEIMLLSFKTLEVDGDLYHITNVEIDRVDDIGHFTFSIKFYTLEIEQKQMMEELILKEGVNNG